ncbi:MAG: hypothetical protein ABI377_11870 [Devosia sp.]|jgi:hypothetical protein
MTLMKAEQIPSFVQDVVDLGCEICAVGNDAYVIGDSDLPKETYEQIAPHLARISQVYGTRDHLFYEIIDYLVSIGRYVDSRT